MSDSEPMASEVRLKILGGGCCAKKIGLIFPQKFCMQKKFANVKKFWDTLTFHK